MATALAQAFIHAGVAQPHRMLASDPYEPARTEFIAATGAKATTANPEVLAFAETVILAVKPDQVMDVLDEIRPHFLPEHCLISIAAGVPLAKLQQAFDGNPRIIRAMPNTPALVGASATAYALGASATEADGRLAHSLFATIGLVFKVKEALLDAVTGLSGSGPAYVYLMIDALSDGGVAAGLPRDIATKLAAQTVLGGAKMVLDTGLHPSVLKDMVTSPGGTTIEGLHELEKGGVRGSIINAVRAAAEKSKRLGQG